MVYRSLITNETKNIIKLDAMTQIVKFIQNSCKDKLSCVKVGMSMYHIFKEYFNASDKITQEQVFDLLYDKTETQLKVFLSVEYILIDDGKVAQAIENFIQFIKENDG